MALGQRARGPGKVYLVGGATAVWYGWRASTVAVELTHGNAAHARFDTLSRELDSGLRILAREHARSHAHSS